MKIKVTWFCLISLIIPAFSHDADVAFFDIQQINSREIYIYADFPWTLRDALIQFDSSLLTDKRKGNWKTVFAEYVALRLRIYDSNHQQIKLLEIEDVPNEHSGHAIQYIFRFEGGTIREIDNQLMFNINEDQKNYHKLIKEHDSIEFVTSLTSPNFKLNQPAYLKYYLTLLVLLTIFLSLLKVKFTKRKL